MPGSLRLTDLLARLRVFGGDVGPPPDGGRPDARFLADVTAALADLPSSAAAWVRDPLRRADPPPVWTPRVLVLPGGGTARQVSATTCGSAVLAMLALAGDPGLALRLARAPDPAVAFAALQVRVQQASTRGPLGIPTWPRGLGTPPWAAARQARFGSVRYTHRVLGAHDDGPLDAAVAAAAGGLPVPLYTGGDLSGGLGRAVPRHVVLLTAVRHRTSGAGAATTATLYEPSSGSLHTLPLDVLRGRAPAHDARAAAARTRALGGWPHLVWTILPCGTG